MSDGEAGQVDIEYLLRLARDKSVAGRTSLARVVSDLFFGKEEVISERERALMTDILRQLIHDVEMTVRRELADRLSTQPNAPRELILTLANDQIEVAHAILAKSEVLFDPDLIEIIRHRTMEHQLAIAMRSEVSENVADALVENGSSDVVTKLLENPNAKISRATMEYLVEQSRRIDQYQNPLLSRPDLGQDLAKKMYWWVSAALRKHILDNYQVDPTDLDDEIEETVAHALEEIANFDPTRTKPFELADRLADSGSITPKLLIEVLRQGEITLFEALFVKLTETPLHLVRRLLFEEGGEGLAVACKAAGIEKPDFASIFLLSRKARPGDKVVDPKELSRVLGLYDRIKQDAAVAVVKRWRRDQTYQDSIRRIEAASEAPAEAAAAGGNGQTRPPATPARAAAAAEPAAKPAGTRTH